MRVVYIFIFRIVSLETFAQRADSLRILLAETKTDSTKTILMSQLADELTKTNPPEAYRIAREDITLAKKIDYERGLFENSFSMAAAFQGQALFNSAILFYHRAYPPKGNSYKLIASDMKILLVLLAFVWNNNCNCPTVSTLHAVPQQLFCTQPGVCGLPTTLTEQ